MSVMQNYGVLRVVSGNHGSREKIAKSGSFMREQVPASDRGQPYPPLRAFEGQGHTSSLLSSMQRIKQRHKYLSRWLPEERLTHILSRRETTIGRALSSDIILLDPTVSRDHVRLV